MVVHDLSGVDSVLSVDFPKDDTAFFCGSETVTGCGGLHLGLGEIAVGDERAAELGVDG